LRENDEFRPGAEVKARLLKIFNRNFSTGHFIKNPGSFLSSKRPNNRGVYVGRVVEQDRAGLTRIKLTDTVNAGDGLAVWVTRGKAPAWTVKTMQVNGRDTGQAHSGEYVDISLPVRVSAGDRVFKTHDAMLISQALESIRSENEHRLPVDAQVFLKAGQPLKLVFKDDEGHQAVACTPSAARNAENQALDQGTLRAKIGRLGNTPFVLRNLDMDGEGGLIVPFSDINEARRAAARDLEETILRDREPRKADTLQFINKKKAFLKNTAELKNIAPPLLTVAVSNASQVRIALDNGADLVYLGLEGLGSRKPVTPDELLRLQSQAVKSGREVIPLLPRIHQEDDRISCTDLMKSSFTKVMAGNWGDFALARQQNLTILADSSFNVFNPWSLAFLLEQGARTVCISPELYFNQLQSWPKFAKVEMLIHGELMLAPSKFCMLGEVLKGENGRCRSVCTQASYCLRDDKGYQFPLAADANCRFYAFNSRTLCLAEDLPRILELGPACIRIEARLPHDSLAPTVSLYREAIDRLLNGEKIELDLYAEELLKCSASAHTKGHYYRGVL
jgi:putative protease